MKWISVEDRLPEKEGNYLTYATHIDVNKKLNEIIEVKTFVFPLPIHERNDWSLDKQQFNSSFEITNWMPLPNPPKEKNEMH